MTFGGGVTDGLDDPSAPKRQRSRRRLQGDRVICLVANHLQREVQTTTEEPVLLRKGRPNADRSLRGATHLRRSRPGRVVLQVAHEREDILHGTVDDDALLELSHSFAPWHRRLTRAWYPPSAWHP